MIICQFWSSFKVKWHNLFKKGVLAFYIMSLLFVNTSTTQQQQSTLNTHTTPQHHQSFHQYIYKMDIAELAMMLESIDSAPATEEDFQASAAKLSSYGWLPDDQKLQFYGLFKQCTIGDVNTKQPWAINMVAKAKWYDIDINISFHYCTTCSIPSTAHKISCVAMICLFLGMPGRLLKDFLKRVP
jgi:hypothetical protein